MRPPGGANGFNGSTRLIDPGQVPGQGFCLLEPDGAACKGVHALIPPLESCPKPLPKSWQQDEDRPMNWTTFPQKAHHQSEKSTADLSFSAGFAQLKRLCDVTRLDAYVNDHEAPAVILLGILIVAGTVLYTDFQPPLEVASGQTQSSASLKTAAAPLQEQPGDEASSPLLQETPPDLNSSIASPPSQSSGLIPSGKRYYQLIKRKGVHHHHRR